MTPGSELDRLFGQALQSIPKPEPLCDQPLIRTRFFRGVIFLQAETAKPSLLTPIDPIDADETNYGVCEQGEDE